MYSSSCTSMYMLSRRSNAPSHKQGRPWLSAARLAMHRPLHEEGDSSIAYHCGCIELMLDLVINLYGNLAGLEQGTCTHERPAQQRGYSRGRSGDPKASLAGEASMGNCYQCAGMLEIDRKCSLQTLSGSHPQLAFDSASRIPASWFLHKGSSLRKPALSRIAPLLPVSAQTSLANT